MQSSEYIGTETTPAPRTKTKGEAYEGIAFTFCKAATIILLTGQYALPIAAGAATVFYLLTHFNGKTDTRCILQKPLLVAAFWSVICLVWLYFYLHPMLTR